MEQPCDCRLRRDKRPDESHCVIRADRVTVSAIAVLVALAGGTLTGAGPVAYALKQLGRRDSWI